MEENQNTIPIKNPVPEQPPVTPLPPVEKPKPKFPFAVIIGIILFLLVAGSAAGFYVLKQQSLKTTAKPTPSPVVQKQAPTPTPDPTANWKTFNSTKGGFSIKYPDSWAVYENIDGAALRSDDSKIPGFSVYFKIIDDPENLSIENKIQSPVAEIKLSYLDVTVNGIVAKRANLPNQQGCTAGDDSVFIKKGTAIYEIQNHCGFVTADTFTQILSTFKFTN